MIHCDWQVVDANAAALALFGYADVAAMAREPFAASGLTRAAGARSASDCAWQNKGARLAAVIYHTVTRDGRRLILRASATRLDHESDPSVLSIFDDITELHEAQEGLRRSETTLSHLVATSPDLITLTDLEAANT